MLLNKVCQGFVQLPGRDGKGQGTAVRGGDPYLARVVGVYCHQFIPQCKGCHSGDVIGGVGRGRRQKVLQAGAVGGVLQQRQQGLLVLLAGSQVIQHPDLLAGCSVCDRALNSIA